MRGGSLLWHPRKRTPVSVDNGNGFTVSGLPVSRLTIRRRAVAKRANLAAMYLLLHAETGDLECWEMATLTYPVPKEETVSHLKAMRARGLDPWIKPHDWWAQHGMVVIRVKGVQVPEDPDLEGLVCRMAPAWEGPAQELIDFCRELLA